VVERRVPSCIDDGGSRWHGAAESRRRTRVVMRAQGGGAVWRHGGIVGRIDEVFADLRASPTGRPILVSEVV
jgi:hypothetical protein